MLMSRTVKIFCLMAFMALAGRLSAAETEVRYIDIYGDKAAPAVPDTLLSEQERHDIIYHRPSFIQKIYRYFAESNDV